MVIQSSLDGLFGALADRTRREIVTLLTERDLSVGDLSARFAISQPAVTKHLNVLERAGLIVRERHGRYRMCRLQPQPLEETARWLERIKDYWEERLDLLAAVIDKEADS